ncbi:MAG TPA: hypothetical protein ENG63_09655 [Candidatus Desulfofervidus auxilii]|uniref:YjeF C-terminal domain-containing protein n=1 Tax=Desulfofervidus auxilii TaxID=1621989 RepID=A0A7C0U4D1_DESA2|nr:hypothetical protein [Candidatus Desulfofervidus auxilii]
MLVIGTVPFEIEIIDGKAELKEKKIKINNLTLPVTIGTTALLAAAIHVLSTLGKPLPHVILSGDKGDGKGTKRLFSYLKDCNLTRETVICGHYMMPYVDEFKKIFPKLRKNAKFIIADAGMMYAAKAAGLARNLDIFTPDAGELAFLADKDATHPAYVKKVLFEIDTEEMESLIKQAYLEKNLPCFSLVKGEKDLIVKDGNIIASVSEPSIEAMEAIGGTGDTLVGILSSLIEADFPFEKASVLAAKINRIAGKLAHPTPATSVSEIVKFIPKAIEEA